MATCARFIRHSLMSLSATRNTLNHKVKNTVLSCNPSPCGFTQVTAWASTSALAKNSPLPITQCAKRNQLIGDSWTVTDAELPAVNQFDPLLETERCSTNNYFQNIQGNHLWTKARSIVSMAPTQGYRALQSRSFTTEPTFKAKVRGIQKDISPLTTKRIVRKKKTKDSPPRDQEVFDVTAYATAEEYDLESLKKQIEEQGLYGLVPLPDDVLDTLHVEAKYRVDDEPREILFFREGSIVFWNIPDVERESVMKNIVPFQEGSYNKDLVKLEFEDIQYCYNSSEAQNPTQLVGDEIQFQRSDDAFENRHQLEKYAFSNALSLSVKLGIWEASLAKYVDSVEWVLQDLKDGKKIKFSEAEILRKSGELFTLRHLINLSSDLLDTPDFYWDRENLEMLYSRTLNYLNIARRTKVMNDKLTHCCELTELLRDHLKDIHHTRLEWMIILLIMLEVAFEVCHTVERYLEKSDAKSEAAKTS